MGKTHRAAVGARAGATPDGQLLRQRRLRPLRRDHRCLQPRGSLFTFWSAETGAFLTAAEVPDGSGLAADGVTGAFLLSSGAGSLWRYHIDGGLLEKLSGDPAAIGHWDNHLAAHAERGGQPPTGG